MTAGGVGSALRHHWVFVVVLTIAATVAAAVVSAQQSSQFKTSALLQVQTPLDAGGVSLNDTLTARERAVTISTLANTADVLGRLHARLPHNSSSCSTSRSGDSEFLVASCKGGDAAAVATAANAYAHVLQAFLEEQRAARTAELARQYDLQIAALRKADVPPANYPTPPVYPNYRELEIIDVARAPATPFAPRPLQTAALVLLLSLLVNTALAVIVERGQNRARTTGALARELGEPILGEIPRLGQRQLARQVRLFAAPRRSPSPDVKEHA